MIAKIAFVQNTATLTAISIGKLCRKGNFIITWSSMLPNLELNRPNEGEKPGEVYYTEPISAGMYCLVYSIFANHACVKADKSTSTQTRFDGIRLTRMSPIHFLGLMTLGRKINALP